MDNNLLNFSKHVPHILRQQLLLKLSKNFLNESNGDWNQSRIRSPTIQRFRGALLFVDISGFTVLSQRLDIESLKNHINDYFTKMLAIVEKWGGDVVKFAGDALFIIWHSQILEQEYIDQESRDMVEAHEDSERASSLKGSIDHLMSEAVERAVACGLEICSSCGHYEVKLAHGGSDAHTHMFDRFMPQRRNSAVSSGKVAPLDSPMPSTPSPAKKSVEEVTYLDVHCGISMGLMAGIDVGYDDRWEFFLAGTPLFDVALAEEKANKGDVVVSPQLHRIIHRAHHTATASSPTSHSTKDTPAAEATILGCGCACLQDGFCRVQKIDTKPPLKSRKNRFKARKEGFQAIANENSKIIEDIAHDMDLLFIALNPLFRRVYQSIHSSLLSPRTSTVTSVTSPSSSEFRSPAPNRRTKDRRNDPLAHFINYELRKCYNTSVTKVLTDDLARHVHDALRSDYEFSDIADVESFRDSISTFMERNTHVGSHLTREQGSMLTTTSTASSAVIDDLDNSGRRGVDPALTAQLAVSSEILTTNAEVRSVTVIFIKIDTINLHILTDDGEDREIGEDGHTVDKVFGFLVRSIREIEADNAILNQIQGCYAILHAAIYGNGGQLRQFIVDDKGTVCIATFGLRGAVSVDNAASAIETAHQIIQGLPGLNLTASIGITTGKAYCGLVGSPLRHEYAVMGPSTNLSARLMCKAAPNSVICDEDTMKRDRLHEYQPLAEIQAKGYAQPVKIFRPVFHGLMPETLKPTTTVSNAGSSATHLTLKVAARQVVRGRKDTRFASLYTFLIRKMHLDWILSNRSKWELEIRDMINSPFFYENEFNRAQRKSVSEASLAMNNGANPQNSAHGSGTGSGHGGTNSFHGIPTPIRKLHGRKREMVVIAGGMGSGKTAVLSAIARKIQFMAERDRCLNVFVARKKSLTMRTKVPFSFWKPMVTSLITLFTKDTTATSLPATSRPATGAPGANIKKIIIGLDKMLRIYSREQLANRDLMIKLLMTEDDNALLTSTEFKVSQLEGVAEAFATLIDFMPALANRFIIIFIEDVHFIDPWSLRTMLLVWKKATGISLLVTYDGDQIPVEDNGLADNAQLFRIVQTPSRLSNTSGRDHFFKPYNDGKRFTVVELPPLDKESTIKVAKEALQDAGILAVDSDLAKLYDISGGNPLYTIELTKALQTIHIQSTAASAGGEDVVATSPHSAHSNRPSTHARGDIKADLNELFNMNSRVEEVICYRFDKLTTAQQLVLKAASVAVSNGRSFTAEMIVFLLEENDHFSVGSHEVVNQQVAQRGGNNWNNLGLMRRYEDTNAHSDSLSATHHQDAVDKILLHLVHHHDFIKLVSTHDRSGTHSGKQYNFTIPLEQSSIYQLVIDEQKEYFHERMARYCRQSAMRRQVDAIDDRLEDLKEEAFHWEHATSWGNALKALMKCAACERERGNEIAWLQHLQSSYGLFKQLEQETGLILPMMEEKLPEPRLLAKILLLRSPQQQQQQSVSHVSPEAGHYAAISGSAALSHSSAVNQQQHVQCADEEIISYMKTLDRELQLMFETFTEVELDVVPAIFFLHISLADAYILAWEDMKVLVQTLGVALRLILAAKYFEIFPGRSKNFTTHNRTRFFSTTTGTIASAMSRDERDNFDNSGSGKGIVASQKVNHPAGGKNSYRVYSFTIPHELILHFLSTVCLTYHTSLQYVPTRERELYRSTKLIQVPEVLADPLSGVVLNVEDGIQNLVLSTFPRLLRQEYEEAYEQWRRGDHWNFQDLEVAIDNSRQRIQRFGMDASLFVTGRFVQWLLLSGRSDIFQNELRLKLLDSFYHIPHIPSLEYLTLFAFSACVFAEDYDTAVQCRTLYLQALQEYKEQVEVSSASLKHVMHIWTRSCQALIHPEDNMEVYETERLLPNDLRTALNIAENLNRVKSSGSDDAITLLTLQCMVSCGTCLNSVCLVIVCGLFSVLPVTINDLTIADELFEKWFQRLVHTMVLAVDMHSIGNSKQSVGAVQSNSNFNSNSDRETAPPTLTSPHSVHQIATPIDGMTLSNKPASLRESTDSSSRRSRGANDEDNLSQRSQDFENSEEDGDMIEGESMEQLVDLEKEQLSVLIPPSQSFEGEVHRQQSSLRGGAEEGVGGGWSILNILNPLSLFLKVISLRQSEGLGSFLPMSFAVLRTFLDTHFDKLLLLLEEQKLAAAKQDLILKAERLRALDAHYHPGSQRPLDIAGALQRARVAAQVEEEKEEHP